MNEAQSTGIEAKRRRRALAQATATLQEHQAAQTYGVIAFHLQAGRIVRVETKVSKKVDG
jgi:hypothetical protein